MELVVVSAVAAVTPTLAILFNTVTEKLELFDIALANSYSVSNDAGAAPIKFATALLTYV